MIPTKRAGFFGLPHGESSIGLAIGPVIICGGFHLFSVEFGCYLWPLIVVIFGALMVAGALYSISGR